jgi:predicted PurR-regulated permease PerM
MTAPSARPTPLLKAGTLVLTIGVSVVFVIMIRSFLIAITLAAIFTGLSYPLYRRVLAVLHGRATLAAVVTLLGLLLVVILPLLALLGVVAAQAYDISQSVIPWVEGQIKHPEALRLRLPAWLPFRELIEHPSPQVIAKIGELAASAGGFLANSLAAAAAGTASFFVNFFVMLYAMFWFLKDGPAIGSKVLEYAPLPAAAKRELVARGMSVIRATIKGTFVIGVVQGVLGGVAFAVAGIHGAAFWGTVMAVASVIPSVGTTLVWGPAVAVLFVAGESAAAVGLLLWCAAVVGSVDNVLRPGLVGGDTEMPDLLILVSTLGGLSLFGVIGILLGPTLAALVAVMWDVFATTFQDEPADPAGAAGV